MMKNIKFVVLFFILRDMLAKYEPFMKVVKDEEGYYRLYTRTKRPFLAICVQSKHVGIYCMPCFEDRSLLGPLEEKLVGKGTLGFKRDDDPLLAEVPAFMERCFQHCVHNQQVQLE